MPDKYQQRTLETWYSPRDNVPIDEQINHAVLQLASEAGELAGLWAKGQYKPGHEMTRDDVLDELGDVLYYVHILNFIFNITTDEMSEYSYNKLKGGHGWNGAAEKIRARLPY